ncbi:hypothetical protein MKW98_000338 [Papaver atlanticum]|uniref:Uncharacterized protein n=1 Tax=Papaver atlanticum TaxID=357466 RepID=A0AAD4X8T8_9MAGN|nr:hypothetical protein MKW98_000338 [Papaver atlanticum]
MLHCWCCLAGIYQYWSEVISVAPRFIEAHFAKEGRSTFTGPFMKYISDGPFLAMKWEGENAVKRACEHVSKKKERPLWDFWPLVYSSDTVKRALEDAGTWFHADSSDLSVAALKNRNMIVNLPDRGICGGLPQEELETLVDGSTIDFNLSSDLQRFNCYLLLRKTAFDMKGLKLEEFGIALIVWLPDSVFDPKDSLIIAGSEFVYVSAEAESPLKFVEEFFPFGIVGWLDPDITDL